MKKSSNPQTKRQTIKERRRQQQRRQRLMAILLVVGGALLITGLLIAPSIINSLTPIGDIQQITPSVYPMAQGTSLGDPNAPVKIEVFEDFQCPACQSYTQGVESLIVENYVATKKVHYTFRHFPFIDDRVSTKESDQAANASMCAAEQGRFWDYHDMLFANWNGENQGAFSDKRLKAFAETLGLDNAKFSDCFSENRYEEQITSDYNAGMAAQVRGTPTVFINGKLLDLGRVPSYRDIEQAVEAILAGEGS